jgi:hypothetical protein
MTDKTKLYIKQICLILLVAGLASGLLVSSCRVRNLELDAAKWRAEQDKGRTRIDEERKQEAIRYSDAIGKSAHEQAAAGITARAALQKAADTKREADMEISIIKSSVMSWQAKFVDLEIKYRNDSDTYNGAITSLNFEIEKVRASIPIYTDHIAMIEKQLNESMIGLKACLVEKELLKIKVPSRWVTFGPGAGIDTTGHPAVGVFVVVDALAVWRKVF